MIRITDQLYQFIADYAERASGQEDIEAEALKIVLDEHFQELSALEDATIVKINNLNLTSLMILSHLNTVLGK